MRNPLYLAPFLLLLRAALIAQAAPAKPAAPTADHSQEAFVIEQFTHKLKFENDGTSSREDTARFRIQSEAGVQQYGVISFSYASGTGTFEIVYVRVRKPDGSVVETPPENVQDMAAEVTRAAPLYSDLHEKHVAVKGLSVGDELEYRIVEHTTKPLAPGQFWASYEFTHDQILLDEQLEISVPRDRAVKIKSTATQPAITEASGYRVYTWHTSNLQHKDETDAKREATAQVWRQVRGRQAQPDVLLSSFSSWEEVGRWYNTLQEDRVKPTPDITAKAAEITKGATSDDAKLRALYAYVSTQFHYIGIDFGIGRYQPHSAADVLANQYGDCKDKHTLLASLLSAAGIPAYPALIDTSHDVDPDVPSPGQFDHVITVVPRDGGLVWLDSTAEVGPYQFLISPLRDKRALAVWKDKPAALVTTPADLPYAPLEKFHMDAKVNSAGLMQATADFSLRGDSEFLLRSAFREVPLPQWKDLGQRISQNSGFGGEVSQVTASSTEKTDEPFHFSYKYERKDYGDWGNSRTFVPAPVMGLLAPADEELLPLGPSWLGALADMEFSSRLELPSGFRPQLPAAVHLKQDFAQYDSTYDFKDGALVSDRRLKTLLKEVPTSEREAYKNFMKAVLDDYGSYVPLTSTSAAEAPNSSLAPDVGAMAGLKDLPESSDQEARRLDGEAHAAMARNDLQSAESSLYRAVAVDPKYARAWVALGSVLFQQKQKDAAMDAFHKAIAADPSPAIPKVLGYGLMADRQFEEAIPVWQDFIKAHPDEIDGLANLGTCFSMLGRYTEAASTFEAAVKLHADNAALQGNLGIAYLHAGQKEKAGPAFSKLASLPPDINTFNNVAYEMANSDFELPVALDYATKAARGAEIESQKTLLPNLTMRNVGQIFQLSAYWDTLGWVEERMSNLDLAEQYLRAAWKTTQSGASAGHLCHLYRRTHKDALAIQMCRLAILRLPKSATAGSQEDVELAAARENLQALLHSPQKAGQPRGGVTTEEIGDAGARAGNERTFKLPRFLPGTESAEFFVLLASDGKSKAFKVDDVKFISGSEKMKAQGKQLKTIDFSVPAPSDVPTHFVRRGILGCYEYTGCSFVVLDPATVNSLN